MLRSDWAPARARAVAAAGALARGCAGCAATCTPAPTAKRPCAIQAEAGWSPVYVFMLVASAGIAILGLLLSSPAVVIGAMLVSPLLGPILGLGFGFATFDWGVVRRSLSALAGGSLLAVGFTALIVAASPLTAATAEILARTRPTLFDLMVAVFAALAGVYAAIVGRGGTVVGVAIATALMPPLATVGFGVATGNRDIAAGALALFLTNLFAIALSATLMARLFGFTRHLTPRQTRAQALLIVLVFAALLAPLAVALQRIGWEAVVAARIRDSVRDSLGQGARVSQLDIGFDSDPVTARAVATTRAYNPAAADVAAADAAERIGRPVRIQLSQIVVDQDATQIAREQAALAETRAEERIGRPMAEAERVASALAAAAGVPREAVFADPAGRRARADAAAPALPVAALVVLEQRVALANPGWRVELVPPAGTELAVPLEAAEEARSAAADQALWALRRWGAAAAEVQARPRAGSRGAAARDALDALTLRLNAAEMPARTVPAAADAPNDVALIRPAPPPTAGPVALEAPSAPQAR